MEAKKGVGVGSNAVVQAGNTPAAVMSSAVPDTSKPAPAPAASTSSSNGAAAAAAVSSKDSEGELMKQELMPAPVPSLKRPREVEDWLLHPPDGSVSTTAAAVQSNQILRINLHGVCTMIEHDIKSFDYIPVNDTSLLLLHSSYAPVS